MFCLTLRKGLLKICAIKLAKTPKTNPSAPLFTPKKQQNNQMNNMLPLLYSTVILDSIVPKEFTSHSNIAGVEEGNIWNA